MKQILNLFIIPLLFLGISIAYAGDDPSIQGKLREDIGISMQEYIKKNTMNNDFIIYDAVDGQLKRLEFDKLHKGIVKKGDFYVSCADFVDKEGNKYDIDFLVGDTGKGLETLEAVVHSVNKKKRKYHVED
jgi:hypothetical protein